MIVTHYIRARNRLTLIELRIVRLAEEIRCRLADLSLLGLRLRAREIDEAEHSRLARPLDRRIRAMVQARRELDAQANRIARSIDPDFIYPKRSTAHGAAARQ